MSLRVFRAGGAGGGGGEGRGASSEVTRGPKQFLSKITRRPYSCGAVTGRVGGSEKHVPGGMGEGGG